VEFVFGNQGMGEHSAGWTQRNPQPNGFSPSVHGFGLVEKIKTLKWLWFYWHKLVGKCDGSNIVA
jgi:hypothetical protein